MSQPISLLSYAAQKHHRLTATERSQKIQAIRPALQHVPPGVPTPSLGSPHEIHRRTGKIARLPIEVRHSLNAMLRDGAPYTLITKKTAENGHKISQNSLSRWHTGGGYADWLRELSCLDEVRLRLGFANDIVHEKNVDLIDAASLRIAVTRLYALLITFEPAQLSSQLATQPGAYTRVLNALCKLTEASIKCERYRDDNLNNASLSKGWASRQAAVSCTNLHQITV